MNEFLNDEPAVVSEDDIRSMEVNLLNLFIDKGCFQISLNESTQSLNGQCFGVVRRYLSMDESSDEKMNVRIDMSHQCGESEWNESALHGYHSAGELSRYNECRSGLIFQRNRDVPDVIDGFKESVDEWWNAQTDLCMCVLKRLAMDLSQG